jgi:hypothetical protein
MDKSRAGFDDLKQIRTIMERSSIFLSLSGFSGLIVGVIGIAASILMAKFCHGILLTTEVLQRIRLDTGLQTQLTIVLLTALSLSLSAAFLFSLNKAKRTHLPIFHKVSRSFAVHFFMPLLTGGIIITIIALRGYYDLILPSTLVFYGLSLLNASKYTLHEIVFLGVISIGLGILAMIFIPYTIFFWGAGFGLCTTIYGLILYSKYEK